jgi:hypothetical protein
MKVESGGNKAVVVFGSEAGRSTYEKHSHDAFQWQLLSSNNFTNFTRFEPFDNVTDVLMKPKARL